MKIDSLKDLEKLIKLCRKTGVQSIKADNVEFHLGDVAYKAQKPVELPQDPLETARIPEPNLFDPIAQAKAAAAKATKAIKDKIATPDDLDEDQLMNYSVRDNTFESQQQ